MGELEDYVKSQLEKGVSKQEIKKNLIRAGWNTSDVNKALSDSHKGLVLAIGVLALLFLSSALVYLGMPFDSSQPQERVDCTTLEGFDKQECYNNIVHRNFECGVLEGEEMTYCYRALENYFLERLPV